MSDNPKFLTPAEVSARLTERGMRVSADRVRTWIAERKIPSIGLPGGKRRMIAASVVDDIMAGKYGEDTADMPA